MLMGTVIQREKYLPLVKHLGGKTMFEHDND